jgi:hypothetical protein
VTRCPFFVGTAQGLRCALASPEEWRALRQNGRKPPCLGGGDRCPFRSRLDPPKRGLLWWAGLLFAALYALWLLDRALASESRLVRWLSLFELALVAWGLKRWWDGG